MNDSDRSPTDALGANITRRTYFRGLLASGVLASTGTLTTSAAEAADVEQVGAGSIATVTPEEGNTPPRTVHAIEGLSGPYPTNDWWTTLLWQPYSENMWVHPLAARVTESGLDVAYPDQWTVGDAPFSWGPRTDDFAELVTEANTSTDAIRADLTIAHTSIPDGVPVSVADWGDWSATYRRAQGDNYVDVTLVQGSPFVYCETGGGGMDLSYGDTATVWHKRNHVLGVTVGGHHYGIFARPGDSLDPAGEGVSAAFKNDGYLAVAVLPDDSPDTLDTYRRHAYASVEDTTVSWEYDESRSAVVTEYEFDLASKHGNADETLTALYPHQQRATTDDLTDWTYVSPRGEMAVRSGSSFTTELPYRGVLPFLPDVADVPDLDDHVDAVEGGDPLIRDWQGDGTYWTGKNFERLLQLAPIAEQVGDDEAAETFHDAMRTELETWFTASEDGSVATSDLFWYDDLWGTLVGTPMGFGADADMNDHHFHYGYWVKAAAEIARRDPDWASEDQYGAIVDHLVRDYANHRRDDDRYPFLRTFSPYAGHSWASGSGELPAGCNQESSSEAINAYAALILWGELTGDDAVRDTGIYLYTHEVHAALQYWFDVANETLPEGWPYDYAGMIWGRGYKYATWFNQDAESIHAINYLPVGGHSFYLGWNTDAASANWEELLANDGGGGTFDLGWYTDVLWEFRALSDPGAARSWYDTDYTSGDFAESRAHTAHWLYTLDAVGTPDATVTADTPLYSVFRDGDTRTYVVTNMGDTTETVQFSDGTTLSVSAGETATTRRSFESLSPMEGALPQVEPAASEK